MRDVDSVFLPFMKTRQFAEDVEMAGRRYSRTPFILTQKDIEENPEAIARANHSKIFEGTQIFHGEGKRWPPYVSAEKNFWHQIKITFLPIKSLIC